MDAFPALPSRFHWTPEKLARAVPPRLSQLQLVPARRPPEHPPRARLRVAHDYRAAAGAMPAQFRIS